MTEKKPVLDTLSERLRACDSITELFKLASSDAFKQDASVLEPDELTSLRAAYRACQTALDGKVRLETFDGQNLIVFDVDWWHSAQYNNDGVTMKFHPESDMSKKYKALTSSAPVVRFFERLGFVPTEKSPVRVMVKLEPVNDAKRAAQGQRIWSIKRLPNAPGQSELPF